MIARGMPYLENMFSLINVITTLASLVLVGIALTHLDTQSTTSKIYTFPKEIGTVP